MHERGDGVLAIMRDRGGMLLALSHFRKAEAVVYPRDFHVGFYLEDRQAVGAMYDRMIADGLKAPAPRALAGGRFAFYVDAPGGFVVEVGLIEGAA